MSALAIGPRPLFLLFRHWPRILAIALTLAITAGIGVYIVRSRPSYVESATVLFTTPNLNSSEAAYTWQAQSLISTGSVISRIIMSPQAKRKIILAGGTAAYSLTLINLYNQDYPDYSYPEATLSASSANPASTRRTYLIAKQMLVKTLASWQRRAGAPRRHRIVAQVTDDSGPVARTGSRKRALAGLLLLGLVLGGTSWSLAGRRKAPSARP
jgi:hypothetical protein